MDKGCYAKRVSLRQDQMTEKIIIAGAGGQGIMLLGKIMAAAAVKEDKYVTWLPAYGAEVRGGAAYCMVVISDREIGSPYIDKADTLIAMNEPSLEKYKNRLKPGGMLIVNSSLVAGKSKIKNREFLSFPFTDIALELGNIKIANMVALGCFLAKRKIISPESVMETIADIAPKDKLGLVKINKQALMRGFRL